MNPYKKPDYFGIFLVVSLIAIFIWSVINPKDYLTWLMEVMPAIIGAVILLLAYKRFKLSRLSYFLLWIHAIILIVGGHYTYAENPLFNWIKEILNLSRNYYDRLGHFAQGFIPAIIAREIILRKKIIENKKWLFFIIVFVILGFSAFYEFIEWWASLLAGEAADAFLATQGDVWDTQWDMFMCFIGSILSLLFLSRMHDKSMKKINSDVR